MYSSKPVECIPILSQALTPSSVENEQLWKDPVGPVGFIWIMSKATDSHFSDALMQDIWEGENMDAGKNSSKSRMLSLPLLVNLTNLGR